MTFSSTNSNRNSKVTPVRRHTLLALSLVALTSLPLSVHGLFGFGGGDATPEVKVPRHDKNGCVAWRQTGGCQSDGPREPKKDKSCAAVISGTQSGYCECAWGRVETDGCQHERLQCAQSCAAEFPAGDLDGEGTMAWIAGSKWHWNNWREVEFKADGSFMAATPDCQQGQCSWSVHGDVPRTVLIQWGNAGMHTVTVSADDSKMEGQRFDGDKCTATLVSKGTDGGLNKDVYSVLGVSSTATDSEIKKAFRSKSKKLHPDLYKGDDKAKADLQFNQVREAYEVLKDADSRVLYDTGGMEAVEKLRAVRQQGEGGGRRQQMGGFGGFFGHGGKEEQDDSLGGLKGPTARRPFEVTLQQLYEGTTISVKLERRVVCRGCRRRTKENAARCGKCNRCPDEIANVLKRMGGFMVQAQERVASKEKCTTEGVLLELVLEQGMPNGHELKFERMGEQSPGKIPGDMIFILQTKEHAVYTRKGNDLHTTLRISLKEALTGFSRKLSHVNGVPGQFVLVETKPGDVVKPMEKRSVSGEGMPVHGVPSTSGNLWVEYEIEMPNQITEDQRQRLMQVL